METAAIRTPGRASERLTGEFSLVTRSSGGLRTHRGLQPALEMSAGLRSEHGLPANSQRMSGSQVKYLLWKVPETQSGAGGGGGRDGGGWEVERWGARLLHFQVRVRRLGTKSVQVLSSPAYKMEPWPQSITLRSSVCISIPSLP